MKGVEGKSKNTEASGRSSITLVLPASFLFSRKHFTTVRLTYAKHELLKLVKRPSINKLHVIKRVFILYIFALLCPEENDLIEAN